MTKRETAAFEELQHQPPKGAFGGPCNRSACLRPGADWYNIATQAYYCAECAGLINWPGGWADTMRLFGRKLLCSKGEHGQQEEANTDNH